MGTLFIVATPIGNLEDITLRALKTIFTADFVACEDTRRTGQMLKIYDTRFKIQESVNGVESIVLLRSTESFPKLISFYDEVEEEKSYEIIELLKAGKNVALVSDAGTPLIADPGFKLVRACLKEGIPVESIPGPSSITSALSISGLPTNNFLFLGYLPPKAGKRVALFEEIKSMNLLDSSLRISTFVAFETVHRINQTLENMMTVFGDIEIVICRELTKVHQEVHRGKISEIQLISAKIKGELVLLFTLQ
jgi:16S rRNA (cytidine1402-2'-O)-methyltransferase